MPCCGRGSSSVQIARLVAWRSDNGIVDAQRSVRFDLAVPRKKVAVEYDGDWRDGQLWALNRARERLNAVHALGWDVVFVTAPLLRDPRRMVRTVRQALGE